MSDYCKKCKKKTFTIYNDYMVSFCAVCKSARPYVRVVISFKCADCGAMVDEDRPGQILCRECERNFRFREEY